MGPTGKVYGLDMTDEMLVLAEQAAGRFGRGSVRSASAMAALIARSLATIASPRP